MTPAEAALMKFGIAMIQCSRESLSDIDGGFVQDEAVKYGVLMAVTVERPCCADACTCAEYGEFPQTCYRYPPEVSAIIKAAP